MCVGGVGRKKAGGNKIRAITDTRKLKGNGGEAVGVGGRREGERAK